MTDDWWQHAACRGADPDVFHPVRGDTAGTNAALAVCQTCPVRDDCLAYAMNTRQMHGVWGGLSANQRKKLASRWVRVMACEMCGMDVSLKAGRPVRYCDECRDIARARTQSEYARAHSDPWRKCPVCRCEFIGSRDCCSGLCLRVYRKQQVAS